MGMKDTIIRDPRFDDENIYFYIIPIQETLKKIIVPIILY